ncbi:hypothetical protein Hanom_Chr06g00576611 [Helianthus anomalus]
MGTTKRSRGPTGRMRLVPRCLSPRHLTIASSADLATRNHQF